MAMVTNHNEIEQVHVSLHARSTHDNKQRATSNEQRATSSRPGRSLAEQLHHALRMIARCKGVTHSASMRTCPLTWHRRATRWQRQRPQHAENKINPGILNYRYTGIRYTSFQWRPRSSARTSIFERPDKLLTRRGLGSQMCAGNACIATIL